MFESLSMSRYIIATNIFMVLNDNLAATKLRSTGTRQTGILIKIKFLANKASTMFIKISRGHNQYLLKGDKNFNVYLIMVQKVPKHQFLCHSKRNIKEKSWF